MSSGNFLTIGSVFYSLLLITVFFSKKRLKTLENKIYSMLIICNFIGLILAIMCYYTVLYNDIVPMLNFIISRLYLIYLVSYLIFPLLLLLIFIITWIILSFSPYFVNIFIFILYFLLINYNIKYKKN